MTRISTALVHHPCLDKNGQVFTTSITNLDVHDIARSSKTYGIEAYYLVTPITAQQEMARAITGYWAGEAGMRRNATRTDALSIVDVVDALEDAVVKETAIVGERPLVIVTSAKIGPRPVVTYAAMRARLSGAAAAMIVFGTGHGLAPSITDAADYMLAPLPGKDGYNHLSVRSAAAIIIDRLLATDERGTFESLGTLDDAERAALDETIAHVIAKRTSKPPIDL